MTRNKIDLTRITVLHTIDADPAELRRLRDKSGTAHNLISRMWRRHFAALAASEKYGFVGVGCITFADNRLSVFMRRVERRFHLRAGSLLT